MMKAMFVLLSLMGSQPEIVAGFDRPTDCLVAQLIASGKDPSNICVPTTPQAEEAWVTLTAHEMGFIQGDF